jgi:4-hydroxybenzoate polyprenyltransferase
LISLRPGQWTKNLIVFAALIFGHRLTDLSATFTAVAAFLVFCGLSGAVYLVNDVLDREQDRRHPLKARRPVASGTLAPRTALRVAFLLGGVALGAAFWIRPAFCAVAGAYLGLLVVYSWGLRHLVILDVLTVAIGFVLRAVAGGVAIGVVISQWLLVCAILLALFLALSKRRHELTVLADNATGHRPILEEYSPYLLDQMISVVTASTLIAYTFYAISSETAERFGTPLLGLTVPLPLYGIFRYLYLVHQKAQGGSPAELLLNDRPLLVCVALWATAVILLIYRPFGFGPWL